MCVKSQNFYSSTDPPTLSHSKRQAYFFKDIVFCNFKILRKKRSIFTVKSGIESEIKLKFTIKTTRTQQILCYYRLQHHILR